MISIDERIQLDDFYKRFYKYFYENFHSARINITRMYNETDPLGAKPYWLIFPTRKIVPAIKDVRFVVKFDSNLLGFEYKVDSKYFEGLKKYFQEVKSLKKFSKYVDKYVCKFEENSKLLFIYTEFEHIDFSEPLENQSAKMTLLANTILDFCWFHRCNYVDLLKLVGQYKWQR